MAGMWTAFQKPVESYSPKETAVLNTSPQKTLWIVIWSHKPQSAISKQPVDQGCDPQSPMRTELQNNSPWNQGSDPLCCAGDLPKAKMYEPAVQQY